MQLIQFRFFCLLFCCAIVAFAGCGNTQKRTASEQLLISDAIDQSIARLDFSELTGEKVYLDTKFLKTVKGIGFVNADYIVSSLRQQLVASRCQLQPESDEADIIVEPRIGTLGTDSHEVTYGIPASNALTTATSLVPTLPSVPTIPEISFAKRNRQEAAAKLAVFAYHRQTGEPIWQSGVMAVRSSASDIWIFGAGPFQSGRVYDGTRFVGTALDLHQQKKDRQPHDISLYKRETFFPGPSQPKPSLSEPRLLEIDEGEEIRQVSAESEEDPEATDKEDADDSDSE